LGDAPYGETAPSMTGAKGEKPVTRSEAEIRDRAWLSFCPYKYSNECSETPI